MASHSRAIRSQIRRLTGKSMLVASRAGTANDAAGAGIAADVVEEVLHATTVASNAILEHKGARTGLITTQGFRDILELRRLRMPRLYDLKWEKPAALVDRYLRAEVNERLDEKGNVLVALDPAEVERVLDRLLAEGIGALAVCVLHSYVNPV